MSESVFIKTSVVDFFFTCVGMASVLMDIVVDILTALMFFTEREFVRLGVLLVILLSSSVLVQAHSWILYTWDEFEMETTVEKKLSLTQLKLLHFLQLGVFFRYAGVMEMASRSFFSKGEFSKYGGWAFYLKFKMVLLKTIETVSESLPQLILMVTTNIQRGHLDTLTVLKSVYSALTICFSMRSPVYATLRFQSKMKLSVVMLTVDFFWNLLLTAARVAALSLFTLEFPSYIVPHFLSSWTLLVFYAWRTNTDFINRDVFGKRLYVATLGLTWYFNTFNFDYYRLLYHCYILLDIALLCGLWFWKKNPDLCNFNYKHLITSFCIIIVYLFGLWVMVIHYHFIIPWCESPIHTMEDLKREEEEEPTELESSPTNNSTHDKTVELHSSTV